MNLEGSSTMRKHEHALWLDGRITLAAVERIGWMYINPHHVLISLA